MVLRLRRATDLLAEARPGTEALLQRVDAIATRPCEDCGASLCEHEALFCVVAGIERTPRCVRCLALALGQDLPSLVTHLQSMVLHRACWLSAWQRANARDGCQKTDLSH